MEEERGQGNPLTDGERQERHERLTVETELPPRGTGLFAGRARGLSGESCDPFELLNLTEKAHVYGKLRELLGEESLRKEYPEVIDFDKKVEAALEQARAELRSMAYRCCGEREE